MDHVMERVKGIEPSRSAWKAEVLPLNYTRISIWRRHPDLNWGIKVLQTSALPLGYAALKVVIHPRLERGTP